MPSLEQVRQWRNRAEELRAHADLFSDKNRQMLLKIADEYDGFARDAEKRAAEDALLDTQPISS